MFCPLGKLPGAARDFQLRVGIVATTMDFHIWQVYTTRYHQKYDPLIVKSQLLLTAHVTAHVGARGEQRAPVPSSVRALVCARHPAPVQMP